MASFMTHHLFGERLISDESFKLNNTLRKYRQEFLFGCQGPDLFFFNLDVKILINKSNIGSTIHSKDFKSFTDKNKSLIKTRGLDTPIASYFLGIASHFILDSYIHPSVNSSVEENYSHIKIETELDKFMLEDEGIDPITYKQEELIPSPEIANKIANVYFGYGASREKVRNCVRDFKFIKKSFHIESERRQKNFTSMLKKIGLGLVADQVMRSSYSPNYEITNEVLYEIFENALADAPELMYNLLDYIFDDKELNYAFYKNFNGIVLK